MQTLVSYAIFPFGLFLGFFSCFLWSLWEPFGYTCTLQFFLTFFSSKFVLSSRWFRSGICCEQAVISLFIFYYAWMLHCIKCILCVYMDNQVLFIFQFVNVIYHFYWFAYVEPSLNTRNVPPGLRIDNLSIWYLSINMKGMMIKMFNNSVYWKKITIYWLIIIVPVTRILCTISIYGCNLSWSY